MKYYAPLLIACVLLSCQRKSPDGDSAHGRRATLRAITYSDSLTVWQTMGYKEQPSYFGRWVLDSITVQITAYRNGVRGLLVLDRIVRNQFPYNWLQPLDTAQYDLPVGHWISSDITGDSTATDAYVGETDRSLTIYRAWTIDTIHWRLQSISAKGLEAFEED